MDRRKFITSAAAVATARFPILGANDRINVGQVGIGGRGTDHINFYSSLDSDCRIVAVCDVNQAARERAVALVKKLKSATPTEFDDMRKMFESKEVDAVPSPHPIIGTRWRLSLPGGQGRVRGEAGLPQPVRGEPDGGGRAHKRMVQVGSQSRSIAHKVAIDLLRQGAIKQIYHARGLCYRRR
jgi:hypothetical protein